MVIKAVSDDPRRREQVINMIPHDIVQVTSPAVSEKNIPIKIDPH